MRYLLILFLIVGCGGVRNSNVDKKDSFEVKNTYTEGSKVIMSSNLTYEPINALKPFKIEGKNYENVKISNSTLKLITKWKTKLVYRTKTIYKTKTVQRKNNTYLWIGLLFVFLLFLLLYLKTPKIK